MARPLLTDEIWELVEPLLPPLVRSPEAARPPIGEMSEFLASLGGLGE